MITAPQADRWRPATLGISPDPGRVAGVAEPEPSALERLWDEQGQPLFHQQCWCWGWDIRRPAGNLLLERGFRWQRPPDPNAGSSAYRLRGHGYRVGLWGFGVHYSRPGAGGVFLGRYASLPLASELDRPPADVWLPGGLPAMEPVLGRGPVAGTLFPSMLRWIAAYERWVVRVAGPRHREDAVLAWGAKTVVAADRMPVAWLDLARTVERLAAADDDRTLHTADDARHDPDLGVSDRGAG